MTPQTPYHGSLLRLAFTTAAFIAALAAVVSVWQGGFSEAWRKPAPATTAAPSGR